MRTLFKLFVFAFSFSLIHLNAQITITSADMPAVSNIYHFHTASTSGVDFATTGANIMWDYTHLINTGFSQDSFVDPITTPLVYQLAFNNFFFPNYDATHAQPGSDIVLPSQIPFTVTNVYNFYKNSSSSFKRVGFGATIDGIPAPIQYQGADKVYSFPLTYGSIDTSSYYFEVPAPSIGYWNQSGTRYNHADGYGTLLLPNGISYQVLRLKSTTQIVDSIHVDTLGFTIPIPRIQTDYKFLALGQGEPVLQITTQPLLLVFGPEVITAVKYKNEMNIAAIEPATKTDFVVYPNPAKDFLTISNPQLKVWNKLQVFNATGQVVYTDFTGGASDIHLSVSTLSTGVYYLVIELPGKQNLTQKITIE